MRTLIKNLWKVFGRMVPCAIFSFITIALCVVSIRCGLDSFYNPFTGRYDYFTGTALIICSTALTIWYITAFMKKPFGK